MPVKILKWRCHSIQTSRNRWYHSEQAEGLSTARKSQRTCAICWTGWENKSCI